MRWRARYWPADIIALGAAVILTALLLGGCGERPRPDPMQRDATPTEQPVLRPRAAPPTAAAALATPTEDAVGVAAAQTERSPQETRPGAASAPRPVQGAPEQSAATPAPESEPKPTAAAEGSNSATPSATPEPWTFTSVTTGIDHTCALLPDGTAYCWGPNNDDEHLDVPEGVRFRQISAGHRFTCGIRMDHGITCWGNNKHNKLEAPEGRFTALDAGWDHACAVGADGTVCWGWNANERSTPPPDFAFLAVGAGAEHSCGLTITGELRCWGKNDNGRADSQKGPFGAMAVGTAHTCVLGADGTAFCQGENRQKQSDYPATVFSAISAGDDHTCGTLPDGTVECWGGAGQISNVLLTAAEGQFTSVSAGTRRTCALNAERHAACWNHSYVSFPVPPYDNLNLVSAVPNYARQQPVDVAPWPDDGLLIADLAGTLSVYSENAEPREILDIGDKISPIGREKGLLGVAVDPDFQTHPFLYVYYTARSERDGMDPGARLSRFPVVNGQVVRDDELVLLENPGLYDFHQGGNPRFGPDGMLYLGIGDGKCADCARRINTLWGKIIRIDVRGSTAEAPYRIPEDNPVWDESDAKGEIWAIGLRNPWRLAFGPRTGALWVADVGAGYQEEVSIVTKGADMGWPLFEGSLCRRVLPSGCSEVTGTTPPIVTYDHAHGCAVIGGAVYRGDTLPQLDGAYLFGDLCSGRVWALVGAEPDGQSVVEIANLSVPIVSLGVDADGEVLVLAFGGLVLRLVEGESGFSKPSEVVPRVTTPPADDE